LGVYGFGEQAYLEDLKDGEEPLFQPIFECEQEEVSIRQSRVRKKWLIGKISNQGNQQSTLSQILEKKIKFEIERAYRNFAPSFPPPLTHQSPKALITLNLSSLPPPPFTTPS
jgi:hypothetical protein